MASSAVLISLLVVGGFAVSEIDADVPAPIDRADYIGTNGGGEFTDENVWKNQHITGIRLRCGVFFDSIQARYGSSWGPIHGQDYTVECTKRGSDYEYLFNSTEYITGIRGDWGDYFDAVTITTNERELPRCGGSGGGKKKTVTGTRLMYLEGRSGCFVDGLQPIWAQDVPAPIDRADYIGTNGGGEFTDENVWNNQHITGIRLRCGVFFDSIQARYGSSWGPIHGQDYTVECTKRGSDYEYLFDSTEYITGIRGNWGDYFDAVTITTNKRELPRCGGSGGGKKKTVTGTRLMYLEGRSGCFVDGLQPIWAKE